MELSALYMKNPDLCIKEISKMLSELNEEGIVFSLKHLTFTHQQKEYLKFPYKQKVLGVSGNVIQVNFA